MFSNANREIYFEGKGGGGEEVCWNIFLRSESRRDKVTMTEQNRANARSREINSALSFGSQI